MKLSEAKAQRVENERIAAEQAAERERLAEAAAKVKTDAEALQKRINEQAEREAKAQAERDAAVKREAEELHRAQIAEQEQLRADTAASASAKIIKEHIAAVKQASAPVTPDAPLYAPLRDVAPEAPAVTFAEPEPADELEALRDMVRWAYSRMHSLPLDDMHDALMLDRMKLYLEHGVFA